ncbi:MAG: hypothetical protein ACR2NN_20575 [Bryobacteraceae bacterium]
MADVRLIPNELRIQDSVYAKNSGNRSGLPGHDRESFLFLKSPANFFIGVSGLALAQTAITVNSTAQVYPTDCTLSNAIVSANTAKASGGCTFAGSGAPYTIQLQNQTYVMSTVNNYWYGPNALPVIASSIVIEGNGATLAFTDTAIVRLRFFYVAADPTAPATLGFNTPGAGHLTLRNLTLTGGKQKGGDSGYGGGGAGMGGAIFNQGFLALEGVTLTGNSATGGSIVVGLGRGGGGLGSDGSNAGGAGGGFGGPVVPAGSAGWGSGNASGGGGGGFGTNDNGVGNQGGGTPDGLGGGGPHGGQAGHGSGGGGGVGGGGGFGGTSDNGGGGFGIGGGSLGDGGGSEEEGAVA